MKLFYGLLLGFLVACGPAVDVEPSTTSTGAMEDGSTAGEGPQGTSTTADDSAGPSSTGDELVYYDVGEAFLVSVSTVIATETPLQYIARIFPEGEGASLVALTPLSLDVGSSTAPRELVEELTRSYPIEIDADGNFAFELIDVAVTGQANPISGSDLVARLSIAGRFIEPGRMCGRVEGMITVPVGIDLSGSTFGGVMFGVDGELPPIPPVEASVC